MNKQHRIRAVIWDLDGVILRQTLEIKPAGSAQNDRQIDHILLGFISAMRVTVHTALLVNSWAEVWEIVHHMDALTPAFDRVIQAVDNGLRRPDPRVFSMAAIRMGITPGETLLVEAHDQHAAAARMAGLQTLLFNTPAQVGSELMGMLAEAVN